MGMKQLMEIHIKVLDLRKKQDLFCLTLFAYTGASGPALTPAAVAAMGVKDMLQTEKL